MTLGAVAVLAAGLHALFFMLMLRGIEPFHTFFYLFAWWTFIPTIAAVNAQLAGNSLIISKHSQLLALGAYSIVVWLFFELFNFRLGNWRYVGVPDALAVRWLAYAVSFATVLPAVLELHRLLKNGGVLRGLRGPAIRVNTRRLYGSVVVGLALMLLVLIWPTYFFPLLWVGPVLILDPFVYRHDREASLLGQAETGSYALALRLMLAGLLCGVLWELWNYWSGGKWIYTIPYFDFWKIFEMPLAGYLGFLPFALECYLFWRVLVIARRRYAHAGAWLWPIVAVIGLVFCGLIFAGIDRVTVLAG